uniref:Odorant receptor n=1 Tax=Campoletis chlorideae TaxID=219166 RepID=A0A346D3Y6_9HYME|nr:odorant receptor [Campoletis chlorideae]
MEFAESHYYRHNARILIFLGQWPYQSSMWNRIRQFFIHLTIFSVISVQMIKMFVSWGNVDIMIECFTPVGVQVTAVIKSINLMINQSKIRSITDHMQADWATLKDENELTILRKFAEEGRKMSVAYAFFLFGSLVIYLLVPLIPSILNVVLPLNDSRQRAYLYETEYFVDREAYFWWIVLHTYIGTILTICTVVSVDAMFATYVQHACGLLAIVSDNLEKTAGSINWAKFDPDVPLEEDEFYEQLKTCVRNHQEVTKLAILIESCFSSAALFQMVLDMVLVSVSLLQLLTKLGQYDQMYRIIQFNFAQLFHLFFNMWPGQKLINESTIFSEAVYYSGWHGFSFRCRSLIKIIMMATARPLTISAFKFYELSMENFGAMLQTSLSYFTVLASLR